MQGPLTMEGKVLIVLMTNLKSMSSQSMLEQLSCKNGLRKVLLKKSKASQLNEGMEEKQSLDLLKK